MYYIGCFKAVLWLPIIFVYYLMLNKKLVEVIKSDMSVFEDPTIGFWSFAKDFAIHPEFRSVVYYRLRWRRLFLPLLAKGQTSLYIYTPEIGHSLFIQHGFSTVLYAKKIGHHFFVNQQVTIGWNDRGLPTIGDYVQVRAGAKIIGDITIGDDVIIGANAVVVKDIPSHSVVVGVPGRIIKTRNSMDEAWSNMEET